MSAPNPRPWLVCAEVTTSPEVVGFDHPVLDHLMINPESDTFATLSPEGGLLYSKTTTVESWDSALGLTISGLAQTLERVGHRISFVDGVSVILATDAGYSISHDVSQVPQRSLAAFANDLLIHMSWNQTAQRQTKNV